MRRLLSTLLVMSMALSIVGCSNTPSKEVVETKEDVTITLPAFLIADEEITQEDLDKAVQEKGYSAATLNEDGSITYSMSKEQQNELLDKYRKNTDETIKDLIGQEGTENVVDITYNNDLTEFVVTTKNEELDFGEAFMSMVLFMDGGFYNAFAGNNSDDIIVIYKNEKSGKEIECASYKEWQKKVSEQE
ncbi:MAG: hypothetical protein KBT48_04795 [Firmicutes bacterium]|nr:hypothetical protein [Bacillota bacterium]